MFGGQLDLLVVPHQELLRQRLGLKETPSLPAP